MCPLCVGNNRERVSPRLALLCSVEEHDALLHGRDPLRQFPGRFVVHVPAREGQTDKRALEERSDHGIYLRRAGAAHIAVPSNPREWREGVHQMQYIRTHRSLVPHAHQDVICRRLEPAQNRGVEQGG